MLSCTLKEISRIIFFRKERGTMAENFFPLKTKHFIIAPGNEKNVLEEEWSVSLNDGDKARVGSIHFENGILNGEVQMKVELEKEYEKSKYVQELFYSMARFVFQSDDVIILCDSINIIRFINMILVSKSFSNTVCCNVVIV